MSPNTYGKVIGRIPTSSEKEGPEEPGEQVPNLKEVWLAGAQTQHFLEHLSIKRHELLDNVAAFVYNNGIITPKQISQLIEAETIKNVITNYLAIK